MQANRKGKKKDGLHSLFKANQKSRGGTPEWKTKQKTQILKTVFRTTLV